MFLLAYSPCLGLSDKIWGKDELEVFLSNDVIQSTCFVQTHIPQKFRSSEDGGLCRLKFMIHVTKIHSSFSFYSYFLSPCPFSKIILTVITAVAHALGHQM